MSWTVTVEDERDVLDEEIRQLERRLADMERGGPQRITSEPEWNRATRRVSDRLKAARAARVEMDAEA